MQLKDVLISRLTGVRVVQEIAVGEFSRLPLKQDLFTGIEIEGEYAHVHDDASMDINTLGWAIHHDDSLRAGGMEFVLEQPLNGEKLGAAITGLFKIYAEGQVRWEPSPRAGTHIHLNASHKSIGFVQAFATLAYCVDELIFAFADEDRRWCSYCNSMNTLPTNALRSLLNDSEVNPYMGWSDVWPIGPRDRYYGCNITSIAKYGTVELRYFPTPTKEEQLWSWLDMSQSLYALAEEFEDESSPSQAVLDALADNPAALLEKIMHLPSDEAAVASVKEAAEELSSVLSVADATRQETTGSRNIQDLFESLYSRPMPTIMTGSASPRTPSYFDEDETEEEL